MVDVVRMRFVYTMEQLMHANVLARLATQILVLAQMLSAQVRIFSWNNQHFGIGPNQ